VGRAVDHGAVWGEVLAVEVDVGVDETNPVVGLDLQFIFSEIKLFWKIYFFLDELTAGKMYARKINSLAPPAHIDWQSLGGFWVHKRG
jgi:hypothetical protein